MPTQQAIAAASDSGTRHSKDDALDDREYQLLLEATQELDDYYDLQTRFIILAAGRLGLRRGEIGHMKESWVDWRRNYIQIPAHEPCHGERDGNGICGYCKQLAEQMTDHNDRLTEEDARVVIFR